MSLSPSDLASPQWRLANLYWITDKDGNKILFRPNAAQRRFINKIHSKNLTLKSRQLGSCLNPSTRVLTADLRWVHIEDMNPGQEIVSVDEFPPFKGKGKTRRMRAGRVVAVARVRREAYRIALDDGRFIICTGKHPWLSKNAKVDPAWRTIEGDGPEKGVGRLKIGTYIRSITKPWGEPTYDDGWFGGILDGEGSISKDSAPARGRIFGSWQKYTKNA